MQPAANDSKRVTPSIALVAHVVPFIAWLLLMAVLGEATAVKYALRAAFCFALLLLLRPWRWYAPFRGKHVLPSVGVGVLVFGAWIALETDFAARWSGLHGLYLLLGHLPPWKMAELGADTTYAPEVCGWPLTIVRILGSGFVISVIEEFFWRGCIYRFLIDRNFLSVDLGKYDSLMFLLVVIAFGLEHQRWIAGIVAGYAYGRLLLQTRDVWAACIAHAVTNVLLGVYVVWSGKYAFWG
jgi:CAAX prenyl protease-like protein